MYTGSLAQVMHKLETEKLLDQKFVHIRYEAGLPDFSWSKHTELGKI
jgi:hypothetical protein